MLEVGISLDTSHPLDTELGNVVPLEVFTFPDDTAADWELRVTALAQHSAEVCCESPAQARGKT